MLRRAKDLSVNMASLNRNRSASGTGMRHPFRSANLSGTIQLGERENCNVNDEYDAIQGKRTGGNHGICSDGRAARKMRSRSKAEARQFDFAIGMNHSERREHY